MKREAKMQVGKWYKILFFSALVNVFFASQSFSGRTGTLLDQLECHSANKKKVLNLLRQAPQLRMTQIFAMDLKQIWRRTIIDGRYEEMGKTEFLTTAIEKSDSKDDPLAKALQMLLTSHKELFAFGRNRELMIRHANDAAFRPFGSHMRLAEAIARITKGNDAEVQAFKTIFETGQNTRGYIHKLECHAEAVEFIYAVTDIVYGVMLPGDLRYGPKQVVADPKKVRLFYVSAGEVIALHPYVLHSGSLSVEPDRGFSVVIYKKPIDEAKGGIVELPENWSQWQEFLKIENVDKYYLTLGELHTADLKRNRGYIADKRPLRLPSLQR